MHRTLMACLIAAGCSEYEVQHGLPADHPPPETPSGATFTTDAVRPPSSEPGWTPDGLRPPPTGTGTVPGGGTVPDPGTEEEPEPPTERDEGRWTDEVTVAATSLVDVLWVVDNSSSMGDDQDALAREFPTFIDFFDAIEGVDYHIGVISTDVEDPNHSGKLREARGVRWLDPSTPDPHGTFSEMAMMGTDGSGDESGRAAVLAALDDHLQGWNAGFLREDAPLSVIVISDENDDSSEFGVDIEPFVDFMRSFKADPSLVGFSTIVGDVPGGCSTADPGWGYPEVRDALGGQFHSICAPDWDSVLTSLAAGAVGTREEFFLTEIPDEDTLEVEVREADDTVMWLTRPGVDFSYDAARNSVTLLTYAPGPLATVYVHYEVEFGALP